MLEQGQQEIQEVTDHLYSSISFTKGQLPDLDKLKTLFIPDGKLINNNSDVPRVMTVDEFNGIVRERIEKGVLSEFLERELWQRTEVFGKIAQRFSTYEAKFDWTASEPFSVGINSIQFIKVEGKWLVSSIVWNDQTESMRIPKEYLP